MSSELKFWLLFFGFNFVLFLPHALFDVNKNIFPNVSEVETGNWYSYFKFLFIRNSFDAFRISVDFSIVLLFFLFCKIKNIKFLSLVIACVYLLFLSYQTYSAFFENVYFTHPLFYSDWSSLSTGFMIVYEGVSWSLIFVIVAISLLHYLVYKSVNLLRRLKTKSRFGIYSKLTGGTLLLMFLFNFKYGLDVDSKNVMQYQSVFIAKNIFQSRQAQENLQKMNLDSLVQTSQQRGGVWKRKPNIYFIAIESYGEYYFKKHQNKSEIAAKTFEESIGEKGWNVCSSYSVAPVTGGLSWISYSNFSYGFDFKNQGTYNALLNDTLLNSYLDIFKALREQGYRNYRLMPLYKTGKIKIPWEKYSQFYRVDEWIKFKDLDYHGELYGFGPSVPDQYALNFAHELMKEKVGPKSLFYLTVSSHNPFVTPEFSHNWRSLSETERSVIDGVNLMSTPQDSNYVKAIQYEYDVIEDFIKTKVEEGAIVVLFGDHQPPFLCSKQDGFKTPVHLITKSSYLLEKYLTLGFKPGMLPKSKSSLKHHELFDLLWKGFNYAFRDSSFQNCLKREFDE